MNFILKSFLQEVRRQIEAGEVLASPEDYDCLQAERLREEFKREHPEIEKQLEEIRKKGIKSATSRKQS